MASLPRSPQPRQSQADQDRFPTTRWFTREDQRHPERYFELAARMPELNRPEERRDTLDYFVGYREKLQRDLEAAANDNAERQEILATIARYDSAISRLRAVIAGAPAK